MSHGFFVVGGPQAAGKSSTIKYLHSKYCSTVPMDENVYKNLVALQEMRQIIIHKYSILGAIFMDKSDEIEIVENDLKRMDNILDLDDDRIYLDECNIFTLAHLKNHCIEANKYFHEYCDRLRRLDASIMFLGISPEISWQRRKKRYEERIEGFPPDERETIMRSYKEYLFELHPRISELYEELDFPKTKIDAEILSEYLLLKASESFEEMMKRYEAGLTRRF
ncbi:MAG: deoxynucleoside kinase [Candidatus Aenigmarchaeota archaeon]|nr:deoxynucleoside kinase [Candidatus Aenigmarchaeota archaeon]MDI6722827.1 deoxynucleoside kinase [Candidatus Aenigmarchaeota archaeon]